MKLPRLSAAEIRALHAPVPVASPELAERIKTHLAAALPANACTDVRMLPAPLCRAGGDAPSIEADDPLLAAWVAARFGSVVVQQPVPEHYRQGMLKRVAQALAELALCDQLHGIPALRLEVDLNGRRGELELGWEDMSAAQLKAWALKQWAVR